MQKGVEKYVEENASMEIKYARNLFRPSGGKSPWKLDTASKI